MTDRHNTLRLLEDGKLTAKQRADFYYRTSKTIAKELEKIKELCDLLEVIPDSYLEKIDFREVATSAMKLTEILIEKSKPAHISRELLDGSAHAERFYTIALGNSLPGLKNATMNLGVKYKPTKEDLRFYQRLHDHKNHIIPVVADNGKYPLNEFVKEILPDIKDKDPDAKITNRGIIGYMLPEEFDVTKEPEPIDPKLLDAIEKVANEIGTGWPQNITAIPDYPRAEDETISLFLKGDYSGASNKLITEMRERQKKEEPK